MIVQFCGLSGSGKSTLATNLKNILQEMGHKVEVLDGDEYRTHICAGLGFSGKIEIRISKGYHLLQTC